MAVAASPSLLRLAVLASLCAVTPVAGLLWSRVRRFGRWLVVSVLIAFILPSTELYRTSMALALLLVIPAATLSARRWRLSA